MTTTTDGDISFIVEAGDEGMTGGDPCGRLSLQLQAIPLTKIDIQSALDIPANQTSIFALTLCE
jgi:hypothetical protein